MGLWSRLFARPPVAVRPDLVWMSTAAKLDALRERTRVEAFSGGPVLLLAHFTDLLTPLQAIAATCEGSVQACLATPDAVHEAVDQIRGESAVEAAADQSAAESPLTIFVAERHPLAAPDGAWLKSLRERAVHCEVTHFLSLDDALLATMVGDGLRELLRRMGMREDEVIESRLVSRRVRDCQKKIEAAATGDEPADSAAEWCLKNMRGG